MMMMKAAASSAAYSHQQPTAVISKAAISLPAASSAANQLAGGVNSHIAGAVHNISKQPGIGGGWWETDLDSSGNQTSFQLNYIFSCYLSVHLYLSNILIFNLNIYF
jgi:hypothetical protein